MTLNSKRKVTTVTAIMGSADFLMGMKDAEQGKPIRDHWENRTRKGVINEQWIYERGRMFFHWLKSRGLDGQKIKEGRRVLYWAQDEFMIAYREKAIL